MGHDFTNFFFIREFEAKNEAELRTIKPKEIKQILRIITDFNLENTKNPFFFISVLSVSSVSYFIN